jgi:F-type H+-transporting ATPase subunit epsilon
MAEHLIHLDIVTPAKIVFSDDVKSFTAPGVEGSFQILPRHAPFITTIAIGPVKFDSKEGETRHFATSGGTVEVHDNKITMLAETIEASDEIDIQRAEAAKQKATRIIESKEQSSDDIEHARVALFRAINRLKVAGIER